jgi:hypothetical protein
MRNRFLPYALVILVTPFTIAGLYFTLFPPYLFIDSDWVFMLSLSIPLTYVGLLSLPFLTIFAFMAPFPLDVELSGEAPSSMEIMQRLSSKGYQVRRNGDKINIRFDKWVTMRLSIKRSPSGTRFVCRLSPSQDIEVLILLSVLLPFISLIVPPLYVFCLYRMDRYCNGYINEALNSGSGASVPAGKDVRSYLLEGLADAHRVANEALRAVKDTVGDSTVLLVALAMISGTFVFFFFYQNSFFSDESKVLWSALGSISITLAGFTFAYYIIKRKENPDINRLEGWVSKLGRRLDEETRSRPFTNSESTVEMLIQANEEMPRWLKLRQKGAWSRYPGAGLLLFFLLTWAATMAINGITGLNYDLSISIAFLIIACSLCLGGIVLLHYVRKWDREEHAGIDREWKDRQAKIVRILEGEEFSGGR